MLGEMGLLLLLPRMILVGFGVGWSAHKLICMRQDGCPKWQKKSMKKWSKEMGNCYPDEQHSHHPTVEVDSKDSEGVPSKRLDIPTAETDLTNLNRKTTP